jgi:bis(5'-nucleosyl)-tetraphosphatase (symmetrical)
MAFYAIGDVQGCREALEDLLHHIQFDAQRDHLWFAGDLVARGPDSLGVLRLVKSLGASAKTVLGNHDLHLLAVHYGIRPAKPNDRTQAILEAPDRHELMQWLRQQPLCLYHADFDAVLTHAGIPPGWSLHNTLERAAEVESVLKSDRITDFLAQMYGNEPDYWDENLKDMARLRVITNFLTRLRLIDANGHMDFTFKEELAHSPEGLFPWFTQPNPALKTRLILFGHWAAIKGETQSSRFIGLDTGCVWGGHLTAYRLEDGKRFRNQKGCLAQSPPKKQNPS